jgi:hypothetical protein
MKCFTLPPYHETRVENHPTQQSLSKSSQPTDFRRYRFKDVGREDQAAEDQPIVVMTSCAQK